MKFTKIPAATGAKSWRRGGRGAGEKYNRRYFDFSPGVSVRWGGGKMHVIGLPGTTAEGKHLTHLDFLHEVKVQTALATRGLLPPAHLQQSSLTSDQCLKSPWQQQNAADCHQQNAGHARKKQGLYFKNAAFLFAISKIPDKIHEERHIFIHTIRKGRGDNYLVHSYCFHLIAGISFCIQTFIS